MKTVILASLALAITCGTSFAGTPLINARQTRAHSRRAKHPERADLPQEA